MTHIGHLSDHTAEERAKELVEELTTTLYQSPVGIVLASRDKALSLATLTIAAAEYAAIEAVAHMFEQLASSGMKTISVQKAAELVHGMNQRAAGP
jgi:hypothetical protein